AKAGNELPAKIFRTDNYKLDFHFAYKDASGAWHNMGAQKTKNHRVYTILGDPVEPWGDGSSSSKVRPWITVLDKLCNDWVKNETTKDDTAKKIVEEVFHSGITYDTKDGASFYTSGGSPTTAPTHAELKKWLNVIAGKSRSVHNGKKVNCTDCGTMVCSLANAVGCELHSSKFYDTVTGASFNCHKIISIGSSTWDYPFSQYYGGIEGKFSYHEIAWKGSCGGSDKIFDACLKVADNPVTSPATNAKYAADMTFNTYKPKLVDPVSLANTNPNPLTKDRRKVR
ncbi:MAG: hypothetical protein GY754_34375, partial [bacterium]|nr:hypothetical protein [bacterium]